MLRSIRIPFSCTVLASLFCSPAPARAQLEFEQDPINYSASEPQDPVAKLKRQVESGAASLAYDPQRGYLPALLDALGVPTSSQVLVFSKTSFQRHRISPRTPRALYFNDDVYIGWVQSGEVVEISAVDPDLGAVFYSLDQNDREHPTFLRQTDRCLLCHGSTHTKRVPGHIVRSVFSDRDGMPVFSSGTFRTDHASPLKQRWGGWYVTGTHGLQRHMGNEVIRDKRNPERLDVEAGANVTDLGSRVRTAPYLTAHSDIVALMVLEHQALMHNVLTAANYSGRTTQRDAVVMNNALERAEDFRSESTKHRYESAAGKVVDCLLMVGEHRLTDPIKGTSGFAEQFAARGPFDRDRRSLRQFDLKRRLFRHPCSYLIHSDAFDALPIPVKEIVYRRLWEVLTGADRSEKFDHLSDDDRRSILEILRETKADLPDYWQASG